MSIEGQFIRPTFRVRRQLAFVRDRIGKGYLDDIQRFEMLERDQEYMLAERTPVMRHIRRSHIFPARYII